MDKSKKQGFTLLELLVVLAVMGIMMGLIGFSLLGGGGNELGAAQRELLGLVQKARSQAALTGKETRLLVSNDSSDEEKYHRYLNLSSLYLQTILYKGLHQLQQLLNPH